MSAYVVPLAILSVFALLLGGRRHRAFTVVFLIAAWVILALALGR